MRSSDGYAGVTVTVAPGAIVKVAKGAQIIIQSGGILNALGANGAPIIFTSLEDDSVAGDLINGRAKPGLAGTQGTNLSCLLIKYFRISIRIELATSLNRNPVPISRHRHS